MEIENFCSKPKKQEANAAQQYLLFIVETIHNNTVHQVHSTATVVHMTWFN